ncbi:MAG TPA: SIS domain-containing protein [Terriglobales bacterium]|nr:SIS domain-containing protein [Terriglobales bacterium]
MSKRQTDNFAPGKHTLSEILSQPQCWNQCLSGLEKSDGAREIVERFANTPEWLFIGCGSSYHVALSAASSWAAITGRKARATPASEILLYPGPALAGSDNLVPVLISRSGKTSEVVKAAEFFRSRKIPTVGISCAPGQPLEQAASASIVLPPADEQSMVMTRSVTSMLLALLHLAAKLARNTATLEMLHKLPRPAEQAFAGLPERIRHFVWRNLFEDYVCLGQGVFYGLACESSLKLTEMSCSYGQAFHTLEFRHGPKSIVGPETLVLFLLSEAGYQAEVEVLEEIKDLGATTAAISPNGEPRARAAADLFVELSLDLPQLVCAPAYVFVAQLLGLYTGLKKGLDPDSPRNLTRVVMLNDESDPQHATV